MMEKMLGGFSWFYEAVGYNFLWHGGGYSTQWVDIVGLSWWEDRVDQSEFGNYSLVLMG